MDNLGAVESILSFFEGCDVHLSFFVKNQVNLKVPEYPEFKIPFEITLVEGDVDDDFAALTEARNLDCFIISNDKFRPYVRSGLVDAKWLESHRILCSWKTLFDGKNSASRIVPSIPLHMLPKTK